MNYDDFHKNAKNIYKIYQHSMVNGDESRDAVTPVPMAAALRSDFPEVSQTVRLCPTNNIIIQVDLKYFNIKNVLYVDPSFFEVFSFNLTRGDKAGVLFEPHSVVLTESTAGKIFGMDDPLDKMIKFENDTSYFRITGICQDPPDNSHFEFDMLISIDAFWDNKSDFWLRNNVNTYVLLQNGVPPQYLEDKFPEMIKKYVGPQFQQVLGFSMEEFKSKNNYLEYKLQPIGDIHLNSSISHGLKPSGNRKYVCIFSMIGIFILIIAGINFINISTSQSTLRTREVGIRKLLGSAQKKLIWQFLTESVVLTIISIVFALLLLGILLPGFNRMTNLSLSLSTGFPGMMVLILIGLAAFIGILAGFYPAFLLSSFSITAVFKDKPRSGSKGSTVRSILVIFQFFIAIVILSGTIVVYRQLKFMQNKDLGFDKEGILVIKRANALNNQSGAFMAELKKYPGILSITNSSDIPGFSYSDNVFAVEGRSNTEPFVLNMAVVDYSYLTTFNMQITDGRDFFEDLSLDSATVIINETAVRKMELKDPIGTRLMSPDENGKYTYHTIIGVVKDFHFKSLHEAIGPYIILKRPKSANWVGYLSIRLDKGDKAKYIGQIENTWKQFTGNRPLEYSFLDEDLKRIYSEEKKTGSITLIFTVLAIFIACLGLLGLISFTTIQRTKEIGLRKIMGATVWSIIVLLSSKTVKLLTISSLLAWPAAYFFLKDWLQDFIFRVGLSPQLFLLTSLIVLGLSLLTIGVQTWVAATRNPVDSLRYE